MNSPQTKIVVSLDDSKIAGQLAGLQSTFTKSFTEIASAIGVAKAAFGALESIWSATVAKALEVERAENKLASALRQQGADVAKATKSLADFNSVAQDKLGIDADSLLSTQATLASIGVHSSQLKLATQATIGLSEATGQDLDTAARAVAKTLAGNAAALTKLGIETADANDAMAKMMAMYSQVTTEAGSMERQHRALALGIGDVAEELGKVIAKSETYKGLMSGAMTILRGQVSEVLGIKRDIARQGFSAEPIQDDTGGAGAGSAKTGLEPAAVPKIVSQKKTAEELAESAKKRAAARVAEERRSGIEYLAIITDRKKAIEEAESEHNRSLRDLRDQRERDELQHQTNVAEIANESLAETKAQLDEQTQLRSQFANDMVSLGMQTMAGYIDAMIQGMARGEDLGRVTADFLGGILRQIGQAMIAMGTATAAFAAATLPAPVAWAGSGGVAGIGAGIAMAGVGTALVAGGSAISAFLGTSASSQSSTGADAAKSAIKANRDSINRYAQSGDGSGGGGGTTIINIEFNRPVGNPRRTAREIADMLRSGGSGILEGIG